MIKNIDVLDGLNELADNSADIVLVDPPYNIGKDFGASKDDMPLDKYLAWSDKWISECERILKDGGTMYIYGFSEILCHLAVRLPFPLEFRWLVWHYTNKAVPKLNFWQRSHESILVCWRYKRIFNLDEVREPYTDVFLKNAAGKVRKGTKGRYSHQNKETIYTANEQGALPRDVIKCPALAGGAGASERWFLCLDCDEVYHNSVSDLHTDHKIVQHPTQKPYELTKRLLLAAKPKEGGHVVIPFIGSGAEAAVAEDLGMTWAGFEINEDYCKLAEGFLKNRKTNGEK